MLVYDKNGNQCELITSANLKPIAFNTNTTVDVALPSERGCAMVLLAQNGSSASWGCTFDVLWYNGDTIIHKVTQGHRDQLQYSISNQTLTITCNMNWSRGFVIVN